MARTKLQPQIYARIVELAFEHWSFGRIYRKYLEISLAIIYTTICKYPFGTMDFTLKPRSKRPYALTKEQCNYIYNIVYYTNPYIKIQDLLCKVNNNYKKQYI